MHHPGFRLPFHVYFDASLRGVGGVLMQERDSMMYPIAHCARKLTSAEINYITTEQEFLAMVYCFQTWRCYLEGSTLFARTDHEPLTWLASQKHLNRRQARWMEFLSGFQYTLLYIKRDKNICADALSCMLQLDPAAPLTLLGDTWPMSDPMCLSLYMCRSQSNYAPPTLALSTAGPGRFNYAAAGQDFLPRFGCARDVYVS
jgi:hypothetical protein